MELMDPIFELPSLEVVKFDLFLSNLYSCGLEI